MSRRKHDVAQAHPKGRVLVQARGPLTPRALQLQRILEQAPLQAVSQVESIVLWLHPPTPDVPSSPTTLNVVDLSGQHDPVDPPSDGLWLVGSEAEYGYWLRQANEATIAVVPYVPEARSRKASASFGSLHVVTGARPSAATLANAAAAAAWAAARAIPAGVAEGSGITGLQARQSAGTAPPLGPDSVV
ncbi:MAG: hypothetical protein JOZ05_02920, partial [Acetobacteraceae bacterium]|nr:hypothetical protein [Acetobacteraceae bacterium]